MENNNDLSYIYNYMATCPTTSKIVNENITLTVNITQGTSPYTITYKKDGVTLPGGIQTQPTIGTYSYTYLTVSGDEVTNPHIFSIEVVDKCLPISQTFTDQCSITISSAACSTLTASISCPGTALTNSNVTITSTAIGGQYLPNGYDHKLYESSNPSTPIFIAANQIETFNFTIELPSIPGTYTYYTIITDSCSPQQSATSTICNINVTSPDIICTSNTKIVGDNVAIIINITQGTAPFYITYIKYGLPLNPVPVQLNTFGSDTYNYTIPQSDIGSSIPFGAIITDSCVPPYTSTKQCMVNILSEECLTPICNYTTTLL